VVAMVVVLLLLLLVLLLLLLVVVVVVVVVVVLVVAVISTNTLGESNRHYSQLTQQYSLNVSMFQPTQYNYTCCGKVLLSAECANRIVYDKILKAASHFHGHRRKVQRLLASQKKKC